MSLASVAVLTASSIWQVRFLLSDCADSSVVENVLQEFLGSIDRCSDAQLVQEAVLLVKELSYTHASAARILLEHLKIVRNPSSFLDVLVPIFASQDAVLVTELATTLLDIEDNDRQFCLILGVILELPVDKNVLNVVFNALRTAINRFSSDLFPPLLRISMKCFGHGGRDLPSMWRHKLKEVDKDCPTAINIWEALYDACAESEKFFIEWLAILSRHCIITASNALFCTTDAFVLLLILSGKAGSTATRRVRNLSSKLLMLGMFPHTELTELIVMARSTRSRMWTTILNSAWTISLIFMEHLVVQSTIGDQITYEIRNTYSANDKSHQPNSALVFTVTVVSELFCSAPSLRETITCTLLAHCFPQLTGFHQPTLSSVASSKARKGIRLPPLGKALPSLINSEEATENSCAIGYRSRAPNRVKRRQQARVNAYYRQIAYNKASIALEILHALCLQYVVVSDSVLQSVFNRIYQQLTESIKVFPSPGIILRLLCCGITSRPQSTIETGSSQLDGTLLILVQKLLGSVAPGNNSLFTTLFAKNTSASHCPARLPGVGNTLQNHSHFLKRMPASLPLHAYTSTSIGVLLASNLLLRGDYVNSDSAGSAAVAAAQDQNAVLNFISRAQPIMQDVSILYALDALCVRMERSISDNLCSPGMHQSSCSDSSGQLTQETSCTEHYQIWAFSNNQQLICTHLKSLSEKTINSFGIISTKTCPSRIDNCDNCTVRLKFIATAPGLTVMAPDLQQKETIRNEVNFNWQIAGMSSKLVQATSVSGLASISTSAHVRHALLEVKDACATLFHLIKTISLVRTLIPDLTGGSEEGVNLSFPRGQPMVASPSTSSSSRYTSPSRMSRKGSRRSIGGKSHNVEDIGGAIVLDDVKSQQILLTWSGCAADAFVGEFVVPAGISVSQALTLAWERGLVVAVLAGQCAATDRFIMSDTSSDSAGQNAVIGLLRLICQLHSARLMLRAAHTSSIHIRLPGNGATSSPGRRSNVSGGRKSGRGAARQSDQQLVSSGNRASGLSKSFLSPSKRSIENLQAELSEDLQCAQRLSLQRLLTRTMETIPFRQLFVCIETILNGHISQSHPIDSVPSVLCTPRDHIPQRLLTDAGLSLVSQLTHRFHLKSRPELGAGGTNDSDCFVSLRELTSYRREVEKNNTVSAAAKAELSWGKKIIVKLLSTVLALLDLIEISRSHPSHLPSQSASTDSASESNNDSNELLLDNSLGAPLDRHGCKLLLLNLFVLLEIELNVWFTRSNNDCSGTEGEQDDCEFQEQLVRTWASYHEAMNVPSVDAVNSVPIAIATQASQITASKSLSCIVSLYNSLEKRILQQQDCTVVTVGLRCLHQLLRFSGQQNEICFLSRIGSVAWGAVRNIYTESTHLAVHLRNRSIHGELIPGMDENWETLAKSVSHQPALLDAIREIDQNVDKRVGGVRKLLHLCFCTKKDYQSTKLTMLSDEHLSGAACRQFWVCWWASECIDERVYGVAIVLLEIFKTLSVLTLDSSRIAPAGTVSGKLLRKRSLSEDSCEGLSTDDEHNEGVCRSKTRMLISTARRRRNGGGAPEQILNKDYTPTNTTGRSSIFPFLSDDTVKFHFSTSLPLLPALFLLSHPTTSFSSAKLFSNGTYAAAAALKSPYENFQHVAMLFIWVTDRWKDILSDQHEHLQLLMQIAPLIAQVCRAVLPAVEAAVDRAAIWRSSQSQPFSLDTSSSSVSLSHDLAAVAHSVDFGSLHLFKEMVNWAYRVAISVREFAELFIDTIIHPGNIKVPPRLAKEIPNLIKYSEHLMSRLIGVSKAHSFNISAAKQDWSKSTSTQVGDMKHRNEGSTLDKIGDATMLSRMKIFLSRHHSAIVTPLTVESILSSCVDKTATDVRTTVGGSKTAVGAVENSNTESISHLGFEGRNSYGFEDYSGYGSEQEDDEDIGFAALTSAATKSVRGDDGGWGLYTQPHADWDADAMSEAGSDRYTNIFEDDDVGDGDTIQSGGMSTGSGQLSTGSDADNLDEDLIEYDQWEISDGED